MTPTAQLLLFGTWIDKMQVGQIPTISRVAAIKTRQFTKKNWNSRIRCKITRFRLLKHEDFMAVTPLMMVWQTCPLDEGPFDKVDG